METTTNSFIDEMIRVNRSGQEIGTLSILKSCFSSIALSFCM